jgi:hypothetical protein
MDIKRNIRFSFRKVKEDFKELRKMLSEWFYFFNNKQIKMESKLEELERRLEKLESNKLQGMVYEREVNY